MHTPQPVEHDPYLATAASKLDQPTALITAAKQPARIRHHPCWCDRQHCITSDTGIRHTSTPTYLTTGEQIFAMTIIQHDPDGEPELLTKVTETGDPDGLHQLTARDQILRRDPAHRIPQSRATTHRTRPGPPPHPAEQLTPPAMTTHLPPACTLAS